MAGRPVKHTVDYFSHDAGASGGKTLTILENHFGAEGYAAWFKLLEIISVTENHIIDVGNAADLEYLAGKMRFKPERLMEILNKMAERQAIDTQLWTHRIIWCQNFVDRLSGVYEKRKQQLPQRPELSTPEIPISVTITPISGTENTQSIVKEIKVEESREETPLPPEPAPEIKPSLSVSADINEIAKLCTENLQDGENINPELIATAINDYSKQWVIEAIREAVVSNNPTWGYVLGILHNCQQEGHSPGEPRSAPVSSCKGCTRYRPAKAGNPERCSISHFPVQRCGDYQPYRVKRGQR
jgi:hypothetical protein